MGFEKVNNMKIHNTRFKIILVTALFLFGCLVGIFSNATAENEPVFEVRTSHEAYNFSVDFIDGSKSFFPGKREFIGALIENKGSSEDTYTLEIKQVPINWTINFQNGLKTIETHIKSNNNKVVDLIIDPPESGEAYIALKVTSKNDSALVETVFISLFVKQPIIKISLDSQAKEIMPGDEVTFHMNITNVQSVAENVTITLTGSSIIYSETPKQDQWSYRVNQSRFIEVGANSSVFISIIIQSPTETVAGKIGEFTIQAKPESDNDNPVELIIKVDVSKVDLIEGTPSPEKALIAPGETRNFKVSLENTGTGDIEDAALYKIDAPAGWDIVYNESLRIPIDRFDIKEMDFKIGVPTFAEVGVYKIKMGISGNFVPVGNFTVEVEVSQIYGVQLKDTERLDVSGTGDLRYEINHGLESEVELILKNNGNGPDTIKLNFSHIPENWVIFFKKIWIDTEEDTKVNTTADFSKVVDVTKAGSGGQRFITTEGTRLKTIQIKMNPGDTVRIVLGINTSVMDKAFYNFTVNTYSGNVTVMHSLAVELLLIRSDLEVIEVSLNDDVPRRDDTVIITVKVRNNYHIKTENITVVLRVSDKKEGEENIDKIQPGNIQTVEFTWTPPKKGLYTINVELVGELVTPGRIPTFDRNVIVEENLSSPTEDGGDIVPILLIIAVIFVFSILAMVIIFFSRARLRRLAKMRNDEIRKKNSQNNGKGDEGIKNGGVKKPPGPQSNLEKSGKPMDRSNIKGSGRSKNSKKK